jgi:hypothetical protein
VWSNDRAIADLRSIFNDGKGFYLYVVTDYDIAAYGGRIVYDPAIRLEARKLEKLIVRGGYCWGPQHLVSSPPALQTQIPLMDITLKEGIWQ